MVLERSNRSHPTDFEVIDEKRNCLFIYSTINLLSELLIVILFDLELKYDDNKFSQVDFKLNKGFEAHHLKFIISEAYDSFIAIQHIRVDFSRH